MYTVVYKYSGDDPRKHNTVQSLNDDAEGVELQSAIDNCREMGVEAELFDETGFRKGWVRADGNYSLN